MVEKALTKGPNREYPDCSQILDVFGCIIECQDYAAMAAVVDAFAEQHKSGTLSIARTKDRWKKVSEGGWRDLMLNIVVNGKVVFEVQVVLHAMLVARKALDAHTAYNQFRSFAEVFGLLELPMEIEVAAAEGSGDGGDGWAAGCAAGAAAAARISELEAQVARLVDDNAAMTASKAAVEAKVAAVEAEKTALAAGKTAVEAEKALADDRITTVEAEKAELAAKVESLQAQLTGRE